MNIIEDEFGFVDIRTFREFQNIICDVVEEYIKNIDNYDNTYYLVINSKTYNVTIENGNRINGDDEKFDLNKFVQRNENGTLEVDIDAVNDVAGKFLFVAR